MICMIKTKEKKGMNSLKFSDIDIETYVFMETN